MIAENNRKLSIFAYYFSKFDKDAIKELGYNSFSEADRDLTLRFGKIEQNQYMKLRRDEFDPLTGSHRKGFYKRNPTSIVMGLHRGLQNYTFEELTFIVKELISDTQVNDEKTIILPQEKQLITQFDEFELENLINAKDITANIKNRLANVNQRIFDKDIPNKLKILYSYKCQICGATAIAEYSVDVTEAHHIEYFSKSFNNNANNLVVLCPDHHRIVHKAKANFNNELKQFEYYDGKIDALQYNVHL